MDSTATLAALLSLLDAGETLLLPNSRSAREMRSAFSAHQQAIGLSAWQPAKALSWQQWASSFYSELIVNGIETRLLLNTAQEQNLWSAIIREDSPEEILTSLLSLDSLAALAASAFQLAASWNALSQLTASATTDDTRLFARWSEAFQVRCDQERYLAASLLDTALTHHITAGTLPAPETLRLVGFDTLSRSQQHLLNALQNRGATVHRIKPVASDRPQQRITMTAATPREELFLAARWLREQLLCQQTNSVSPEPRIAVLNPDLAGEQASFEAILREVLTPELLSIEADLSSTPWEFSSGAPLNAVALIADALDLIRWSTTALPQSRVSALLLSPYLNPGVQRELAAQLDARIRSKDKRLRPELSLTAFLQLLDQHHSTLAWPRRLAVEIARAGDITKPRTYAAWMEFFRNLVQSTGWSSTESRPLNATEFAATRAWEGVLDLVSTLDFSGQRVSLAKAIEALELQVQTTQFIPPSTNASVQIMRPSEIEGAIFDAVIFLHATDASLPTIERVHPLLPWALQSSLGMPGTDPVRSSSQAREATQSLLDRCNTALFTVAAEDDNGEIRPSPLLSAFSFAKIEAPAIAQEHQRIAAEIIADDQPLPPLPSSEVHGGSRLLQLQAACGFRAFAELRLNSVEPDAADIGFDALESGIIVHTVLQELWTRLESQAELAALSAGERRSMLELCIADALRKYASGLPWDDAYLSVVRERLLRLITAWTELELRRGPFVIQGRELDEHVQVGPLNIKVRVDRIDGVLRTENGIRSVTGSVLVDYKTGASANPKQWDIPRPEEPQLPLYTLLFESDEIKAITFAKLIAGEDMRWSGMQSETGILPAARSERIDDLPTHIAAWRAELAELGQHFADGHAEVSPKDPIKTCQFCAQRILCRVNELTLTTSVNEEEEDGDE